MHTTDVRVRRAVAAVAAGRPVVVTVVTADSTDPTETANTEAGYLVFAADAATPKLLAFTIRHTSGLVRIALPGSECERLNLPPMGAGECPDDAEVRAQRVTVDWRGTGTGISATDRARTIAALADPASVAADFDRPGHVLPVLAAPDGVLGRPGPAEAAVDLARLAGRREAAVLCDLVSRDHPTAMAGVAEAVELADQLGLAHVSLADLTAYRRRTEQQVVRVAETIVPIRGGDALVVGYRSVPDGAEHLALIVGAAGADAPLPLHVHVECLTGDVFGARTCRCGADLDEALATMTAGDGGVVIYLRPPGARACGVFDGASVGQHGPAVGHEAPDSADVVEGMLRDLGLYTIRLSEDAPALGLVMFGAIRDTCGARDSSREVVPA